MKTLCNADILTQTPEANTLWVGLTADGREVVINHPEIRPDKEGAGYITFSPDQARGLADLLRKHADGIDGGGSWKKVSRT